MVERVDIQRVFPLVSRAGSVKRMTGENQKEKKEKFNERLREEGEKKSDDRDSQKGSRPFDQDDGATQKKNMQGNKVKRETGDEAKNDDVRERLIDIIV